MNTLAAWHEVFKSAVTMSSTLLTSLLIHVAYVIPGDATCFNDLFEHIKMECDCCVIKALGMLGIKSWGPPEFDTWISPEESVYPISSRCVTTKYCYSMTGPLSISLVMWYQARDIHAIRHTLLAVHATSQGSRPQGSQPRDHCRRLSLTKEYPLG